MMAHVHDFLFNKIVMLICVDPFVKKILITSDVIQIVVHMGNLIGLIGHRTPHEQHTLTH